MLSAKCSAAAMTTGPSVLAAVIFMCVWTISCQLSLSASMNAANPPPRKPKRCPSQEIPSWPGIIPHNMPPKRSAARIASGIAARLRSKYPRASKIAQESEDDAAGANVNCIGTAKEPDPQATDQSRHDEDEEEVPCAPHQDKPAENEKWHGIRKQMPKSTVQKWRRQRYYGDLPMCAAGCRTCPGYRATQSCLQVPAPKEKR